MVGGMTFATIDILNTATQQWSQAALSVARSALAATSVRASTTTNNNNLNGHSNAHGLKRNDEEKSLLDDYSDGGSVEFVLFAGGLDASGASSAAVDIFNANTLAWTTGAFAFLLVFLFFSATFFFVTFLFRES
jgi:hypothetical protein